MSGNVGSYGGDVSVSTEAGLTSGPFDGSVQNTFYTTYRTNNGTPRTGSTTHGSGVSAHLYIWARSYIA